MLEKLKPSGYVRYMDDIIVLSESKSELKKIFFQMKDFIADFSLTFKQPQISLCERGIPFLGFLVDGKTRKLNVGLWK